MFFLCMAVVLPVFLFASQANAGDVVVRIDNVADARGDVIVGLCTPNTFLSRHCPYKQRTPARRGSVTVRFRNVPPGIYAAQAMHDENDNNDLDVSVLGVPTEGVGVSNNPPVRIGRPSFREAAFQVSEAGAGEAVRLRYFN